MDINNIFAFWGVAILFIITPGVDWAYAIAAGLDQHRKNVIKAVTGMLCGHLIAIVIVAVGVGKIIADHQVVMEILTVAGALYLLWLGINTFKNPPGVSAENGEAHRRWLIKGFCISGLNPKVFLLLLALMPQFIDQDGHWANQVQMLVLGSLHLLSCGAVYLLVGFSARLVLQSRPKTTLWVGRFSGIAMTTIAVILLINEYQGIVTLVSPT